MDQFDSRVISTSNFIFMLSFLPLFMTTLYFFFIILSSWFCVILGPIYLDFGSFTTNFIAVLLLPMWSCLEKIFLPNLKCNFSPPPRYQYQTIPLNWYPPPHPNCCTFPPCYLHYSHYLHHHRCSCNCCLCMWHKVWWAEWIRYENVCWYKWKYIWRITRCLTYHSKDLDFSFNNYHLLILG